MLSDFRYALRQFAKNPGFTAIAVLILALGVGANTAVFTFIDGILLRGLPVRDPQQLVLVCRTGAKDPRVAGGKFLFSYPDYEQFRDHSSLAGLLAVSDSDRRLIASGLGQTEAIAITTKEVSGNYFSVLGVPALLGETLSPDDDRKGSPRAVAVLSYAFWQRIFGGDPAVLGKSVLIDKVTFSVIGVAPSEFSGEDAMQKPDVWIPIQTLTVFGPSPSGRSLQEVGSNWLHIMGRLRLDQRPEAAMTELNDIYQGELADAKVPAYDVSNFVGHIDLQPGGIGYSNLREQVRTLLLILISVVGLVLVIGCANVTSLSLARIAARQREFALRSALGAARGRLIRQLMTESILLAGIGGLFGLVFAYWGTEVLAGYLPGTKHIALSPDRTVLLFVTGVSTASSVFIGLIPALRFSAIDLVTAMKDRANTMASGSRQCLGKLLVVAQIALSLCLLAGAGLFVRTLSNLKNIDLGLRRENLLAIPVAFDRRYDSNRQAKFFNDVRAGLAALPGVSSVSFADGGLLQRTLIFDLFGIDGYLPASENEMFANYTYAGPQFFETSGIPLERGTGFSEADFAALSGPPDHGAAERVSVAVISASLARHYFGDADPIGRTLRDQRKHPYRIVGVAKNAKYSDLRDDNSVTIYLPLARAAGISHTAITFLVRAKSNSEALIPSSRAAIQKIDPKAHVISASAMNEVVDQKLAQERTIAQIASYFSLFAVGLASIGLYGVLAFSVTQRTREIGVRMALGADMRNIFSLIVGQGLALTLVGCIAGTAAAIALSRFVANRLYGVAATDPITYLATIGLLLVVAGLACWLPANRAAKVDPITALRAD